MVHRVFRIKFVLQREDAPDPIELRQLSPAPLVTIVLQFVRKLSRRSLNEMYTIPLTHVLALLLRVRGALLVRTNPIPSQSGVPLQMVILNILAGKITHLVFPPMVRLTHRLVALAESALLLEIPGRQQ